MEKSVELLLDSRAYLGEGPAWDAARRSLWWVNIMDGEVHLYDPQAKRDRAWMIGQTVGFAVPAAGDSLVLGLKGDVARFHPFDSAPTEPALETLASAPTDEGLRWNDGKAGPDGRLYAGTMDLAEADPTGSLYRLGESGLAALRPGVCISNGIAWSPDGATLYHVDTPSSTVDAYDFDRASGAVANRRPAFAVPKAMGWPDGMCCDAQGRLWVALWAGAALSVWDPAGGKLLDTVPVPAKNVTSCCFGGDNLDRLFVTTARKGVGPADLRRYPLTGGLFALEPGCVGQPTGRFGTL